MIHEHYCIWNAEYDYQLYQKGIGNNCAYLKNHCHDAIIVEWHKWMP